MGQGFSGSSAIDNDLQLEPAVLYSADPADDPPARGKGHLGMTSGESKSQTAIRAGSVAASAPLQPARIQAASLFGGGRELVIVHQEEEYRLRVTRKGKLILTK
jgi:hemin uptake protein HemP